MEAGTTSVTMGRGRRAWHGGLMKGGGGVHKIDGEFAISSDASVCGCVEKTKDAVADEVHNTLTCSSRMEASAAWRCSSEW